MIKLFFSLSVLFHAEMPQDSVGVETINGKMFVIHKVDEKETLYAIARRYRATVAEIIQNNKEAESGLEIGQILKVPYTPKPVSNKTAGAVTHKVEAKETMYSISKMYGVSMEDIKSWNNLTDNTLSIGQELVIKNKNVNAGSVSNQSMPANPGMMSKKGAHTVAPKETMYSIAKQYGITVDQLREWNNLKDSELQIGQMIYVVQPVRGGMKISKPADTIRTKAPDQERVVTTTEIKKDPEPVKQEVKEPAVQTTTIKISESVRNGDEIIEGGLAELIEGTDGNRKYLALHRTAPIGTILKIKNVMNNREVFVRVMGKLPDTADSDKLIIRISKSAYDRLGAIDSRFRVEVTYYK